VPPAIEQSVFLKDYCEPDYWVKKVDLSFLLAPTETVIVSKLAIERNKTSVTDEPLILDGDDLQLVSVSVNGKALGDDDYTVTPQFLKINNVPGEKKFHVSIETRINPEANTKLMGLYRSNRIYCTQCEADGFRRITYFPDRPDVLAVYTVRIEADKADCPVILCNGNPVKKGRLANGRHFAVWHDPHPKPSYLFGLVAGDLGSIKKTFTTHSGRKVRIGVFVEKGKEPRANYALDALVRAMRWDEENYNCEYDLDVFNIVAVSDFNMGAMENKGLNIFNDKYVLADPTTATDGDYANIEAIIAHEYFHNWTGNRITCRDWFQLCLKEGLTVYRDQEFSADQRSRAVKRIEDVRKLKANQFPEDAGPLAHPVRPDKYREINNFYTATVYEKGAEIVRMLHTLLGDKLFQKGIQRYLRRYDGTAATVEDFLGCFETVSKRDLSQFSIWYAQAGTPTVSVSTNYDSARKRFTVELEQTVAPTPGQSRKRLMEIPLRINLLSQHNQSKRLNQDQKLVLLCRRQQKLIFEGVRKRPVLSLNRNFTAPININYTWPKADLAFLAEHDDDPFNRWEALQTFATRELVSATTAITRGKEISWDQKFREVILTIATDLTLEPAYRAVLLTLPSEMEIAQSIGKNIDPAAIHNARENLLRQIGKSILPVKSEILNGLTISGDYQPNAHDAGKRSLHNIILTLALASGDGRSRLDVLDQFNRSDNMTDRYSALQGIVNYTDSTSAASALAVMYEEFREDNLVLDKWFMVQAAKPGAHAHKRIRKLMRHDDFSYTNPNRVRSTIGVFAANSTGFNTPSGKGYELVANCVKRLDKINPQIAARLLTSFRSYKALEPGRRKLAHSALEKIFESKTLSRDVYDILSRTLES